MNSSTFKSFNIRRDTTEAGFSLIELLTVLAIIGVLAQLAISIAYVYRGRAEFAKADSLYRNARTAAYAGEQDNGENFSVDYTESLDSGGGLMGDLATAFPGLVTPKDVVFGASVTPCTGEDMAINLVIASKPCRGDGRHIQYTRFCNGVETLDRNAPGNGC
jgi:prepilin-type N-terminal cleavage/methylation domain-containing protein